MRNAVLAATQEAWHVPNIPVADFFDTIINWLRSSLALLWEFITVVVETCVTFLTDVLTFLPPWGIFLIFPVIGFFGRGWMMALFTLIAFALIDGMDYFVETMETQIGRASCRGRIVNSEVTETQEKAKH